MHKEIIIDGVDVSKCSRLIVNKLYGYACNCEEDEHLISSCKNRPNCYFKQLAYKTHEYQNLADMLRATDIYSEVCCECRDDILLYPSISGKTSYTDNEVDRITLRKIIDELKDKTQKCKLAEQLIAGVLKTLNLEAYNWRADQNEIITEIKAFKQECEELKKQIKQLKDTIKREKEAGYSIIERLL